MTLWEVRADQADNPFRVYAKELEIRWYDDVVVNRPETVADMAENALRRLDTAGIDWAGTRRRQGTATRDALEWARDILRKYSPKDAAVQLFGTSADAQDGCG